MRKAIYRLAYLGLAPVKERENRWRGLFLASYMALRDPETLRLLSLIIY